jgi:hypothetical protein
MNLNGNVNIEWIARPLRLGFWQHIQYIFVLGSLDNVEHIIRLPILKNNFLFTNYDFKYWVAEVWLIKTI